MNAMRTGEASHVIVGGGIFGLSLAFELARLGHRRVEVVEQKHVGYGASSRNIGRVRTSQFNLPLATFAKGAFAKHRRLADELGSNTLFWTPGYALVFYDEDEMTQMDTICDMLRGLGQPPEFLRGGSVVDRLPILRGGEVPAGCLIRPDASVHHDALLYAYRRKLAELGVSVRESCTVTGVLKEGGEVAGVRLGDGEIRSRNVVNACGGWSRQLSQLAGLPVPNVALRREVLVTDAWLPLMTTMITFYRPIEGWFHQTLRGEVVIGAVHPDEPQGMNMAASDLHIGRAARHVLRKAPRLGAARIVRQWAGVYDMTPDRLPMVGPSPGLPGFFQANGDNGRGIALIPYLAELLARWMHTRERPAELEMFDPARYLGREDTPVVTGDYYAAYKKAA
jgi:sarcosine oxidase subunit beta